MTLVAASGCNDEVGGDGFVPDRPSAGKGGLATSAGAPGNGGVPAEGGAGGEPIVSGGKAGSTSRAGSAGKGGHAGTSTMTEGGMGGETGTAVCGNKMVEPPEQCDDGNTKSGDGCTADCKADCEVCEKTYCTAVHEPITPTTANFYDDCYQMPGIAESGKAQGVPRKELCQAVVDCVRKERCAQLIPDDSPNGTTLQFMRCFCDRDVTETAYLARCGTPPNPGQESNPPDPADNTYIEGKCANQFMEASERDTVAQALQSLLTAKLKPFGAANLLLLECDRKLCLEECIPEASAGTVAQVTDDILAGKSAAGESALGDLVADSQRAAMNTDFAFVNLMAIQPDYATDPWGLLLAASVGRPADAVGRVLESEALQVFFGFEVRGGSSVNRAVGTKLETLELTGAQIHDFLNQQLGQVAASGLTYTWDAALPVGSQVTEVQKDGSPLAAATTYTVAVTDQLLGSVPGAANVVASPKAPSTEWIAFLKAQTEPIAPPSARVVRLH